MVFRQILLPNVTEDDIDSLVAAAAGATIVSTKDVVDNGNEDKEAQDKG